MSILHLSIIGAAALLLFAAAQLFHLYIGKLRLRAEEAEGARYECEKHLDVALYALADARGSAMEAPATNRGRVPQDGQTGATLTHAS